MIHIQIRKKYLVDYLDGFTDIHNHLLPGIDDGVHNTDHALYIINRLSDYGITSFIATPHIMADVYPNNSETITAALDILKKELIRKKLNHIKIKAAAEYMIDSNFEKLLEKNKLLTLTENYLLIELSYFQPPINLENVIIKIISLGYIPILAHPERYNFYHHKLNQYHELKKLGCLFQLNALSLTNYYGKSTYKTAKYLLKNKLIDYLGSDIHHAYHARELTETIISKNTYELLVGVIDKTKEKFGH